MDRNDKIKYIFVAIKNGVSKRQIDLAGKGISIKRLEENKPVTDKKVDEMFGRAVEFSGEKVKEGIESVKDAVSNVSQYEFNYLKALVNGLNSKIEVLSKRVADLENDNAFLHRHWDDRVVCVE